MDRVKEINLAQLDGKCYSGKTEENKENELAAISCTLAREQIAESRSTGRMLNDSDISWMRISLLRVKERMGKMVDSRTVYVDFKTVGNPKDIHKFAFDCSTRSRDMKRGVDDILTDWDEDHVYQTALSVYDYARQQIEPRPTAYIGKGRMRGKRTAGRVEKQPIELFTAMTLYTASDTVIKGVLLFEDFEYIFEFDLGIKCDEEYYESYIDVKKDLGISQRKGFKVAKRSY